MKPGYQNWLKRILIVVLVVGIAMVCVDQFGPPVRSGPTKGSIMAALAASLPPGSNANDVKQYLGREGFQLEETVSGDVWAFKATHDTGLLGTARNPRKIEVVATVHQGKLIASDVTVDVGG